jgi:hypothetical protein
MIKNQDNIDFKVVEDFGNEWTAYNQKGLSDKDLSNAFYQYFNIFPFEKINSPPSTQAQQRGGDGASGSSSDAQKGCSPAGKVLLECVWSYFNTNRARLVLGIQDFSVLILNALMNGIAVEVAFAPYLKTVEVSKQHVLESDDKKIKAT